MVPPSPADGQAGDGTDPPVGRLLEGTQLHGLGVWLEQMRCASAQPQLLHDATESAVLQAGVALSAFGHEAFVSSRGSNPRHVGVETFAYRVQMSL